VNGVLFQLGGQNRMKKEPIGEILAPFENKTDWDKLRNMSDAEVHAAIVSDSNVIPTNEEFWQSSKVVVPHTKPKEMVTIPLDYEVLEWLQQEHDYPTLINAILLDYMQRGRAQ
jgi:uncharacterized protein (DUF4415 family)